MHSFSNTEIYASWHHKLHCIMKCHTGPAAQYHLRAWNAPQSLCHRNLGNGDWDLQELRGCWALSDSLMCLQTVMAKRKRIRWATVCPSLQHLHPKINSGWQWVKGKESCGKEDTTLVTDFILNPLLRESHNLPKKFPGIFLVPSDYANVHEKITRNITPPLLDYCVQLLSSP